MKVLDNASVKRSDICTPQKSEELNHKGIWHQHRSRNHEDTEQIPNMPDSYASFIIYASFVQLNLISSPELLIPIFN